MPKRRFSARAQRKAKLSRQRTKKMLKAAASRSGPVRVYYLPGFGPIEVPPPPSPPMRTKFPFEAWINGQKVRVSYVSGGVRFDHYIA